MTVSSLAPKARRQMRPPDPPDPVTAYALDVVAGRVVVGSHVRKAAERHLADLAGGHERGLRFDLESASRALAFAPLLRHYKGEWGRRTPEHPEGRPITLEPWQMFIIGCLFGWKRADGTRRFRKLYLEVAKKNGKTLLAAVIAILLAFFDDEPAAEVYALATKRDQAKLVWTDGKRLIAKNPVLSARIRSFALSLVDESTASFFRPLGRDSDEGEQGVNAHGAIVDELHVLKDRDDIDNIETAMSARSQPVLVEITTAGVRRESAWWEERADALSVVEGRATDDSMLVLIYTLDEGDDPFDEAVWPKANPNLGVSVNVETLREQAAAAKRSPGKLAAFLRYRMDLPTTVSTRALDMDEWAANSGLREGESYDEWVERTFEDGREAYAGLDLASVKDLTALVLLFRDDGGAYDVLCRFWCPEEGIAQRSRVDGVPYADWVRDGFLLSTPGNVTDYSYVREEIQRLSERFVIREIGFDRWNATQLATELTAEGAEMVAIPQTQTGLGPGWRELDKVVLGHRLRHGDHPVLRWMAGNVEVETDAAGNQKPSKRLSSERIDGIVALDMAMGRWAVHVPESDLLPMSAHR